MNKFSRRRINIYDSEFIVNLVEMTTKDYVIKTLGHWDLKSVREDVMFNCANPNARIIQVNNIDVGVVLVEETRNVVELKQLYILPLYQRKGIGSELLHELITDAKARNCKIILRVMRENTAKVFYERLGFIVIEETSERYIMEHRS